MCVVAFAWNVHPRWRLLLIGNRDEFHGRPSSALAPWPGSPIVAGRDLLAGGTWVGISGAGRCAVVTNVRDGRVARSAARSRGELPVSFLGGDHDALAAVSGLAQHASDYAPFNLVLLDAQHAAYLGNHPDIEQRTLPPGLYGMSNGGFDAPWPKALRVKAALRDWLAGNADDPAALWAVLGDGDPFAGGRLPDTGVGIELERRLSPVFIDAGDYGTRASTLIAIDHDGAGWIAERRFVGGGTAAGETRLPIAAEPGAHRSRRR